MHQVNHSARNKLMQFIPYKIRSNQPHFDARALTLVHALSMCVFLVHAVNRGEYTGLRSTKLQDPHGKGDGRRRPARIALHSNSPPTSKERLGGRWSDCLIDANRPAYHSCTLSACLLSSCILSSGKKPNHPDRFAATLPNGRRENQL